MWAIVGNPLSSVVIPVWLNSDRLLPEVVTAEAGAVPDVCRFSLELKNIMVPSTRGSTKYYINTTKVFNADGTGITQRLLPLEQVLVEKATETLSAWRQAGKIEQSELARLYNWIDDYVRSSYKENFGLGVEPQRKKGR
ncbi:MAG: hypothetical protein IH591_11095 [Bacteroidales bacterium]|nr:hypothetical protein [Bacteroidales bacterium]